MTIEGVREYKFDPKEVIEGLNGYYARGISSSFIRVYRDFGGPVYLGSGVWLSVLIEWLRVDHDIFYYPGMEAKLAKTEQLMDKGALSSLKKLHKRVTGEEPEVDSHTLIADNIRHSVYEKESEIEKLKEEIRNLNAELATTWTKTSLINWLQQGARHKGVELDDAFLYSDDAQYDWTDIVNFLFDEIVKMKQEIKETRKKHWNDLRDIYKALGCDGTYDSIDGFAKAVKARAEYVERLSRDAEWKTRNAVDEQLMEDTDYVADVLSTILEALGISKSNTVRLDVFGLKTKAIQRASVIKAEHDRYLEQLDKAAADYQALDKEYRELKSSQKSDANKLIRDCCANHGIIAPSRYLSDEASVEYVFSLLDSYSKQRNEACADRDRAVDDYKLKLKDYILHDIKKRGYRYDGLETKSIEDIVDWIIEMATCANKEVEDAQKETKRKCYWYLWEALKKLSPECDALKIDCYENLVDRIFYEMSLIPDNCKQCQRKHSTEKLGYIQRANKAEEEVKKLNDVIKKLKQLLNEINKEEENEWFKP